jgi:nitrogen fixation protein FixH
MSDSAMRDDISIRGDGCRTKEVTGRTVLVWLVAFFGIVAVVNVVMIRAAVSTYGGLETESSYQAGLVFARETADARAQDALSWRVDARLSPARDGTTTLVIDARDADGRPLRGLAATARLVHPADQRDDHAVLLRETRPGEFSGAAMVAAGQWDLVLELARDGTRVFRSKNRVMLR